LAAQLRITVALAIAPSFAFRVFVDRPEYTVERKMTYPLCGDSSKYSYISFAISLLISVLLAFVWREHLVYGNRDSTRIRRFLMTASMGTASASALGQVTFNIYRWIHIPHLSVHEGPILVIALSGLVISLTSLLSVFAAGSRKWLVVLSSLVLTTVWFFAVLDNINW
jgi:putative flippase GtrA